MASFCFRPIGLRLKIQPIQTFQTFRSFEILLEITVIWHLHSCLFCIFSQVLAWMRYHRLSMPRFFHSSNSSHVTIVKCFFFSSAIVMHSFNKLFSAIYRLRSFLCGLTLALRYFLAAISTKMYYNIEIWLTLSGAILFYGIISLIGYVVVESSAENVDKVI